MKEETWIIDWNWLAWTFGVVFGPEVTGIHLGPLTVSYVLPNAPKDLVRDLYWRWRFWRLDRWADSNEIPQRPSTDDLLRRIDGEGRK